MRCLAICVAGTCIVSTSTGMAQDSISNKILEIGTGVAAVCNTVAADKGRRTDQEVNATATAGLNKIWNSLFSATIQDNVARKTSEFEGLSQDDIATLKAGDRECRDDWPLPCSQVLALRLHLQLRRQDKANGCSSPQKRLAPTRPRSWARPIIRRS